MKIDTNWHKEWQEILSHYLQKKEFKTLYKEILKEYENKVIYPAIQNLGKVLETPFGDIKVVILGQDPYHQFGQAQGLAFSVPSHIKLPPSLKNIYKEIELEFGIKKDFNNGDLIEWTKQGVFLLNSVLTVEEGKPGSHQNLGWQDFTDYIIKEISDQRENIVFLLWGNYAKQKKSLIDTNKHLVLESAHPSPFSVHRGFFGNNHFIKANKYLLENNLDIINW